MSQFRKASLTSLNEMTMKKPAEGFVLQLCHGKKADGLYYDGDGDWTTFDNAMVYYSRDEMKRGLVEAKQANEDAAAEVVAFGVYLARV